MHDRVATRSWCHRIVPDKVPSPVCALCGLFEEDLWFWQDVVSLLSLQELLPSDDSIWLALTSLCSSGDLQVIDEDVLVALGATYSTVHFGSIIGDAS